MKPPIFLQPVGALNADRLKKFQERYSSFEDPVIPKFHYGSHYSSAGTVRFPFCQQCVLYVTYLRMFGPPTSQVGVK